MQDHPAGTSGDRRARVVRERLARIRPDLTTSDFLRHVVDLGLATTPGVDGVSVTLLEGTALRAAVATAPWAALLDQRQVDAGRGPGVSAATTGRAVRARLDGPDGHGLPPGLVADAARLGVRGTAALGLWGREGLVGALTLYRCAGEVDDEAVASARVFAASASSTLAQALDGSTAPMAVELRRALRSRLRVARARGVLAAAAGEQGAPAAAAPYS